jgi:cold shock CspA family protein
MTGAIRSLGKGFGFIAGDDGRNYYFHWSGLAWNSKDFRELVVRERVSFGVTENSKKSDCPRAIDIMVLPATSLPSSDERGDLKNGTI